MFMLPHNAKIGILGGGQLGKMLAQEASRMDLKISFLDPSPSAPVSKVCSDVQIGDFNHFQDVLHFGSDKDILSIEIEHVDIKALEQLVLKGIQVYPQPEILKCIQDKGLQKEFYKQHDIPTAGFALYESAGDVLQAVQNGNLQIPFVQKLRIGGYDGKGVQIVRSESQLNQLLEGPCVIEAVAAIQKEIGVIAVRNRNGQVAIYTPVSMDFHPEANLVEDVVSPAEIPADIKGKAEQVAERLIRKLGIVGLLAVEMFYNEDGSIWVNEMAPRPHNSGHLTLDNGSISQFENHLRAILDLPLGETKSDQPCLMMNLLGEAGYSGPVVYEGLNKILELPGVHLYLYGKSETRPFRKMGHINITGETIDACKTKAQQIRQIFKIKA